MKAAFHSDDPWVRYGASCALSAAPPSIRASLAIRNDTLRATRVQTSRSLGSTRDDELLAAEMANAFRGDAWLNLAASAQASLDPFEAERALRIGLVRDPSFTPLRINLADLLRDTGHDAQGIAVLEAAQAQTPDGPWAADLAYALGLAHWRAGNKDRALDDFRVAAQDGSVAHLQAWVLAERELRGGKAGLAALKKAQALRPGNVVWGQLAADWQATPR